MATRRKKPTTLKQLEARMAQRDVEDAQRWSAQEKVNADLTSRVGTLERTLTEKLETIRSEASAHHQDLRRLLLQGNAVGDD